MARFRSSRPSQNFQRQRRRATDWSGLVSSAYTTLPASSAVLAGTFVLSNPGIGETIIRTVGVLSVASDQTAALEPQFGSLGMVVVTDAAGAAGIASIPDPVTEEDDDGWFLFVPFLQQLEGVTGPSSMLYSFDSRGKRRIEEGFQVAVVIANAAAVGLKWALNFRVLAMRS